LNHWKNDYFWKTRGAKKLKLTAPTLIVKLFIIMTVL